MGKYETLQKNNCDSVIVIIKSCSSSPKRLNINEYDLPIGRYVFYFFDS
jgi:hypothetical protein